MVDGAANENAVSEEGDLDGHDWTKMTGETDRSIESEKFLEAIRDIAGSEKVTDEELIGIGVDEVDACVITFDVNVTVFVSDQTAGERWKTRERFGETAFKKMEDASGVEIRGSEEAAFLDVVTREHGEIGDGEFKVGEGGRVIGEDNAFREKNRRRRRSRDWHFCVF